ncbi:MAG: hypothetical protein ACFE8U_10480 [Candidatus Hermodarchaeota archaeon]
MVYRLTSMSRKKKGIFVLFVWIFSAIFAIVGSIFIATAVILPQTRYSLEYNELVDDLRKKMGPWTSFNYLDYKTGDYFENITLYYNPELERLQAKTRFNELITDFQPYMVEEWRINGIVHFLPDPDRLEFFIWYNTTYTEIYEVEIRPDLIWIDLFDKTISLRYKPNFEYKIFRWSFKTDTTTDNPERELVGRYFTVRHLGLTEWARQIYRQLIDDFFDEFIQVSRNVLIAVAIGGGFGIVTAFFLVISRLARIFGGKYWTFFLLKRLNGKFGKLLSYLPIFNFDGDFYVEEGFVDIIDLSSFRSTLRELYIQRLYDILIFPTALAAILTIFFVQYYPGEKSEALTFSPLLSPIALVLLVIYFPLVWAFNEGGFKLLETSPQGDINAIKPLGKIMRDGLGVIIGFSGFLSLGVLGVEVGSSTAFMQQPTTTGQIQVAGFTLDLFGLLLLVLWTLGLFFLLLGSIIVGASLLAINNLENSLLPTIKHLREKSAEGLIENWGSVTHHFSPVAKETIFTKKRPNE